MFRASGTVRRERADEVPESPELRIEYYGEYSQVDDDAGVGDSVVEDGQEQRKDRHRDHQQRPVLPVREKCAGSGDEPDGCHRPKDPEHANARVSDVHRAAEERRLVGELGDIGELEIDGSTEEMDHPVSGENNRSHVCQEPVHTRSYTAFRYDDSDR